MRIRYLIYSLLILLISLSAFGMKRPIIVAKSPLFREPDVDSEVIDDLVMGDTIIYITEEGDWSKVVHGTDYGWVLSVSLGRSKQDILAEQKANEPKRTYMPPQNLKDLSVTSTDELFEQGIESGSFTVNSFGERYIPGAGFESETPYSNNPYEETVAQTSFSKYEKEKSGITAKVPNSQKYRETNSVENSQTRSMFESVNTSHESNNIEVSESPYSHSTNRFGYQGELEDESASEDNTFGYENEPKTQSGQSNIPLVSVDVPISQRETKTAVHMATEQKPLPTDNISFDPDMFTGTGIGYPELNAMTGKMVRDLLACPIVSNKAFPPRVIIDGSNFRNESSQPINLNLITDDLRTQLIRASAGRILFVAREYVNAIEHESQLNQANMTSNGYYSNKKPAGADYKLAGRIVSQNIIDPETLHRSNYFLFTFEMIDLNNGFIVWSNNYKILKEGADSLIYK